MMYQEKAKPKAKKGPLDSVKSVDPIRFPPCQKVLEQQIKRVWFVSRLHQTATEAYLVNEYTPIDFGWKLSECGEYLQINWFDGAQVSSEIENLGRSSCDDDEGDRGRN